VRILAAATVGGCPQRVFGCRRVRFRGKEAGESSLAGLFCGVCEMEPDSQKNRQPRRSALTSALEELALQSDAHAEDEVRAMRPHESRARLELRPLSALPPPCKKQLIF
jgi:hypothetical protein